MKSLDKKRLLQRYDAHLDEHGPLKADGEPRGLLAQYQAASNSKRAALKDLADRLSKAGDKRSTEALLSELSKYRSPGSAS